MNYLKVPNSDIQLTDGSVVMLARFPGTKWVVHYGWYDYSGRRAMGWYFSSIPAQTVIPATNQDLQLIVVIDNGGSEGGSGNANLPAPSIIPDPTVPGPSPVMPSPCPPGPSPCPPGPTPPSPCPPGPVPGPTPPFHPDQDGPSSPLESTCPSPIVNFSKNDKYLLDASWISLPSIKYRDYLSSIIDIPDGKVVKINNVDGKTRYYAWDAIDQRWNEKFYENDAEELLVNYYTKEEIDIYINEINSDISNLQSETESSINTIRTDIEAEATARQAADEAEATARSNADDALQATITDLAEEISTFSFDFDSIMDRLDILEEAVFNIQKIVAEATNTVIVSDSGTMKDSGVSIGDDSIDEPVAYASPKTLATEKAVVKLVDENVVQWSSF